MFLLFGFEDRRNGERPLGKGDDDICASTDGDAAGARCSCSTFGTLMIAARSLVVEQLIKVNILGSGDGGDGDDDE